MYNVAVIYKIFNKIVIEILDLLSNISFLVNFDKNVLFIW